MVRLKYNRMKRKCWLKFLKVGLVILSSVVFRSLMSMKCKRFLLKVDGGMVCMFLGWMKSIVMGFLR